MSNESLCIGDEYNFKNQPERLKYIGKHKGWHQFEKIGSSGVWCELLDSDLHLIEKTQKVDLGKGRKVKPHRSGGGLKKYPHNPWPCCPRGGDN